MKQITFAITILIYSSLLSQSNINFESGNFTGWTGCIGANLNSNVIFTPCSTATPAALNGTNLDLHVKSYFAIMTTAAANDPYGLFSLTSPLGGNNIARLGNEATNVNEGGDCSVGSKNCSSNAAQYKYCSTICGTPVGSGYIQSPAEFIRQSYTVTAANSYLRCAYAVVLNDGNHPAGIQPYFEIKVTDGGGTSIPCFYNKVLLNTGVTPAGWTKSAKPNCWYGGSGRDVYYKGWTVKNMDLSAYIGQTVTIQYTVAGCVDGGHFGYAYFDATTSSAQISAGASTLCPSETTTVTAPPSSSYSWSASGGGSIGGVTNTQTVNALTPGTYTVTINSGSCATPLSLNITNCVVLPIVLDNFYGHQFKSDNVLEWSTISETNNNYFLLEKSNDGYSFNRLTNVDGAGNSQSKQSYQFIDNQINDEITYYRLSQIDFDGKSTLLKTISVENQNDNKTIVGYYNLMGESVNELYKGFVIVRYSDGSIIKIIQ